MSAEYTAMCQGASDYVIGRMGPITITQDGSKISVGEEARGEIDGNSVTFRGSISLGSTSDENLTFEGTVDDGGTISGIFSGTYSTMVWAFVLGLPSPRLIDCSISKGYFILHPTNTDVESNE